jgi:hypothetical protein
MATNLKIHPNVDRVIKPIINDMSRIDIAQRTNPIIGAHNEPDYVKEIKKQCVHVIFEDGEYRLATQKNANGELVCSACGRVINTKFDKSAVDKITAAIEVVNQVLLFGMLNGLQAAPIETLISLKKTLPGVAQLASELNDFVKRTDASADSINNLGAEYATPDKLNSITSY